MPARNRLNVRISIHGHNTVHTWIPTFVINISARQVHHLHVASDLAYGTGIEAGGKNIGFRDLWPTKVRLSRGDTRPLHRRSTPWWPISQSVSYYRNGTASLCSTFRHGRATGRNYLTRDRGEHPQSFFWIFLSIIGALIVAELQYG